MQFRRPVEGSYKLERNWSAAEAQLVDDDETDIIVAYKHFAKAAPEAVAEQEPSPEDVEMAETQQGAGHVRLPGGCDGPSSPAGSVQPAGAEVPPAPANVQLKPTRRPGAARAGPAQA